MIQRIQTLWLSLAVLLSIAAFFFPLAMFQFPYKELPLDAIYKLLPINTSPYQEVPAWSALIMCCLSGIVGLVAIFLYKNRPLQMRIVAFAFLFSIVELALLYFYQIDAGLTTAVTNICKGDPAQIAPTIEAAKTTWGMASFFPIAQIIFYIFALQAIKKDEILVRSSERLR